MSKDTRAFVLDPAKVLEFMKKRATSQDALDRFNNRKKN